MYNIMYYGLREVYNSMKSTDRLAMINIMIDLEPLRVLVREFYINITDKGGRPNIDAIFMIKTIFLQRMYNCADEVMEIGLHDRIYYGSDHIQTTRAWRNTFIVVRVKGGGVFNPLLIAEVTIW